MSEQFSIRADSADELLALLGAEPGRVYRLEMVPNYNRRWWQFWKPKWAPVYWTRLDKIASL